MGGVSIAVVLLLHLLMKLSSASTSTTCSESSGVTVTFRIKEELNAGTEVANIKDSLNSTLMPPYKQFFFFDEWLNDIFDINYTDGIIKTKVKLDREKNETYSFFISKDSIPICITIIVEDVNDISPLFSNNHQEHSIPERAPHHKISLGSVTDLDAGVNSIAGFRLVKGNDDYAFNVTGRYAGPQNQKLLLDLGINGTLDYETTTNYSLIVEVYDGGNPARTSQMTVDITVIDTNDNLPIFNQSKYFAAIYENLPVGTSILQVYATDNDDGENGIVRYSIDRTYDPGKQFVIDAVTGVIKLNKRLDYEMKKKYKIYAIATDKGNQSIPTTTVVEIDVLNINEQPADIYLTYLTSNSTSRISENASVGFAVARVSVSDPEASDSDNSDIALSLQGGDNHFELRPTGSGTFSLLVKQKLDREIKNSYNITLIAEDSGSPPLSASRSFTLYIDDVNDNAPKFHKLLYKAEVEEMSEAGSSVLSVTATDADSGENSRITYHIQNDGNAEWFHVDSKSGLITTQGQVDCEVDSHPSFILVASDQGDPALSSSVMVEVSVRDINDKEPTFDQSQYYASVPEDKNKDSCILQVNATDPDCGVNGQIRYFISNESAANLDDFYIEEYIGRICVNKELDHETKPIYEFSIIAKDTGDFATTANIQISVTDINDNFPVFYPRNYSKNIQDNSLTNTDIITVQASDADSGDYGKVVYSILSGNDDGKFRIDGNTGTISLQQSLPSGEKLYRLVINAVDGAGLGAQQTADVYISVKGPGYNPPQFERSMYRFTISEAVGNRSLVGTVKATYAGSSNGIRYSITSGDKNSFFEIDPVLGTIKSSKPLDHDEYPSLLLNIMADIGNTPLYGTAQVNVTIEDINDNAPQFSSFHVTTSISEAVDSMTTIYSAHATDKDSPGNGNGEVRYSLKQGFNKFNIDATSGEIHLSVGSHLDYEQSKQYKLVIYASDQGQIVQHTSSMTLVVNVQDANDNTPTFLQDGFFQAYVSESDNVSSTFLQVVAADEDSGENGKITYSLVDSEFSSRFGIFPSSGNMYLKERLDREVLAEYRLIVTARDHGQPSKTATASVVVYVTDANDNAPIFSQSEFVFTVEENLPAGTSVGLVIATDADMGNNRRLQYKFVSPQDDFSVSDLGLITTTRSLNRELKKSYDIVVQVQDSGSPVLQATAKLHISVSDVNDHAPVIQNSQFVEQVDENRSKGVRVVQIFAEDPDNGDNGTISYSLVEDGDAEALDYFTINPKTGWITTKEVLDYETKNKYRFKVVAMDGGSPSRSVSQPFVINVNDDNDEAPIFPQNVNITYYIVENTPINTAVGQVEAHDGDGGENGRVSYYIIAGDHFGLFFVDMKSGTIYTMRDIDFEESSSHTVGIKAVDNNVYNPKSSVITIKIFVIDVNDNTPIFEHDPVFLTIKENTPISTVVHTFTAIDADSGTNGTVNYKIINSSVDRKLEIDTYTGRLTIAKNIDYEEVREISMIVKAFDQAPTPGSQLFSQITVMILVLDENDNAPIFQKYSPFEVLEDEPVGYRIASIIAQDADGNVNKSGNSQVTYTIKSGNDKGVFHIQETTGILTIASPLDREKESTYNFRISARDHGSPYIETETTITVNVLDVNDNSPYFERSTYQANVTENSIVGTIIMKVSATDADEGENGQLTYMIPEGIANDYFSIDPVTGLITLTTSDLDREKESSYIIAVNVQDSGSPLLYDMATIIINVTDVNDSPPTFKENQYFLMVPENIVQDAIYTFVAHDADIGENAQVVYSITDGNSGGKFVIGSETGILSCKYTLDRESVPDYVLKITASDGRFSSTTTLNVKVTDQNDNDPVFERDRYSKLLFENVDVGFSVLTVSATDADEGDSGMVTYSLHNDSDTSLFEINSNSGLITTKGTFDREKKSSYSFDVLASDNGTYDSRSEKVRVEITIGDINDNPPVFQEVPYRKNVSQGIGGNSLVLNIVADDKDTGLNGEVTYKFSADSDSKSLQYFSIDVSGRIYTKKVLDMDAVGYHNLKVIASDKGSGYQLSATGVVEITVGLTSGPNTFQFKNQNYSTSLYEHARVNSRVITVELDNSPGNVVFSFASGNTDSAYSISSSGVITVINSSPIDYETTHHMRLIVAAESQGVYAYTTVWVNLIDINDNAPQFSQDRYVTRVYEEQEKYTYVMQVSASDADSPGPNSEIVYNIVNGNWDQAFEINPSYSGLIRTNLIVDYEIQSSYKLIIEAKDNGANGTKSSSCTVKISVIDINDNPPKFPNRPPVLTSEATEVGTSLTMVTANDVDISPPVTYNFSIDGNPDDMFSIDRYSGMLRLSKPLDHEKRKHYMLGLQASDGKHVAYTKLEIQVTDENDNAPVFSQQSYQVSLEELTPHDHKVIQVNASDADDGLNAMVTYSLVVSPSRGFYIDEKTGIIYTNETVTYRQNQEIIHLVVTATDGGQRPLSALVAVYIQITSVNKHSPAFLQTSYSTTINEDTDRGFIVMHVEANDKDTSGRNKEIDFKIVSGNIGNVFVIDQKEGRIMLNRELDYENRDEYNLLVVAQDRGLPPRNSTVEVHIIVQDVNDQVPYFNISEYYATLNESFPSDTSFLKIAASDGDTGAHSKIYYTITSGNEEGLFIINGVTGDMFITPNETLDYEHYSAHKLVIRAMDCNGCTGDSPRFSNITTVYINVTDVNEFSPEFPVEVYFEGLNETMPPGSKVFEAHANDKDGGYYGIVKYNLTGTNLFSIHYQTGVVTSNTRFDYETTEIKEFRFEIYAEDRGGKKTSVPVVLRLIDVDDHPPVFEEDSYKFELLGSAKNGTYVGSVRATDQDAGSAGNVVYRFIPSHKYFRVNASTGEIRVSHDLNREIAREVNRRKREINTLVIEASSGMDGSYVSSVLVDIDVDRTCAGCEMQYIKEVPGSHEEDPMSVAIIIVIVISVVALCLIVIIVLILMRNRYRGKNQPHNDTPMHDTDEFDQLPSHTQSRCPPSYGDVIRFGQNLSVNVTTSSDMSHRSGSSGRGSAEDDEDEELAMINSSSPSYLNNSNGFRKAMPDSGIQDDDNTSEPSVQNHQDYLARLGIDTAKINSKAKSGMTHSVESMHQFSDSGGGEGDGLEIDQIDYSKHHNTHLDHTGLMDKNNDMGFHEPEPHMAGSLSNVINSEEEYSGSYNWDYLLDWGPQYQPLAHVFSEIARLKDDTIQPKKQAVQIVPQQRLINTNVHSHSQVRMLPPPMITSAPPKAVPQPALRSDRSSHSSGGVSNLNSARNSTINTSLPSMPRSPISHESSFTSPALTPSFTPSLSPLATRSPSISPVNSGRGIVSSNHSSGPATPRGQSMNNNKYGFSSSSSEQELRI